MDTTDTKNKEIKDKKLKMDAKSIGESKFHEYIATGRLLILLLLVLSICTITADATMIFCETLPAPSTGRVCEVTTGDNSLLIKGNVLDFDTIYQGGEVLVDQTGLILYVGCSADRPQDLDTVATGATKIECAEGVISPGLINPHDHLPYNHNYPFPATDERYDHRNDWRPNQTVGSDIA